MVVIEVEIKMFFNDFDFAYFLATIFISILSRKNSPIILHVVHFHVDLMKIYCFKKNSGKKIDRKRCE